MSVSCRCRSLPPDDAQSAVPRTRPGRSARSGDRRRADAARSPSCASVSTDCRWRSSWPHPGCAALTPVELVANLEERFRLLVGGRRSRMERHQTMRGTLDWSYDLCTDVERAVFDRLSVFPAGFDLPACPSRGRRRGVSRARCGRRRAPAGRRSLLQRSTAIDGTTRYRMLETMRAYGREHLQHQGLSDTTRAAPRPLHGRHDRRALTAHARTRRSKRPRDASTSTFPTHSSAWTGSSTTRSGRTDCASPTPARTRSERESERDGRSFARRRATGWCLRRPSR